MIRKLSKKREAQNREYLKLRNAFLLENPICQANLKGCTKEATDNHHMKGKIGLNLTDVRYFLAVCRQCHCWIELHPLKAKELGLSKSRLAND